MIDRSLARARHVRHAHRHDILARRHIALERAVERLALEVDDRVVVADRGDEQPLGVGRRGRRHDLQPRRVHKPGLGVLAVKGAGANAAVGRRADHPRHGPVPAIVRGGGKLDDGVKGRGDEVGKLHLDHRAQPHQRHPAGRADKAQLGQRHVDHAAGAELGFEVLGDLERAAKAAGDVLAHQQHVGVAAHLLAQRLADRRDVGKGAIAGGVVDAPETKVAPRRAWRCVGGCGGHGAYTPSVTVSGAGSGLASAYCQRSRNLLFAARPDRRQLFVAGHAVVQQLLGVQP